MKTILLAGAIALIGCAMPKTYQIDDEGRAVPGGPMGRHDTTPKPVTLSLSKPGRGMIGRTVTIAPGRTETILDWQTDDDESAIPVTLVLGIPNTPDNIAGTLPSYVRLKALIKYGIGGSQNETFVDVVPGTMITLPASYIRVDVISDVSSQMEMDVSAFLCRFATDHPPAKYTVEVPVIPVLSDVLIPVPSLARSFRVYEDVAAGKKWQVFLLTSNSAVAVRRTYTGADINDTGDITIPGDVFFILITNADAATPMGIGRLVFDLY